MRRLAASAFARRRIRTTILSAAPLLFQVSCGGGAADSPATVPSTPTPTPVTPAAVASVAVTLSASTLLPQQRATATAVIKDASGAVLTGRTIVWSVSDTSIADITPNGATADVRAKKIGDVTVSAVSEGRTGTSSATIKPVPAASVTITPGSGAIIAQRTLQMSAAMKDSAGGALSGRSIAWSTSNAATVTISSSGLLTGVAPGTATISATVEGKVGSAAITVTSPAPSGSWGMATQFIGTYSANDYPIPFGVPGDFNGDGLTDFLFTGWAYSNQTTVRNPPIPLKIYLQASSGTFEDATSRLLGSELNVYSNVPFVADLNRDGADDIAIGGFTDFPSMAAPGTLLMSGGGKFTKTDLPTMWSHGGTLADADGDGCIDLLTGDINQGLFRGDCLGNVQLKGFPVNGAGWVTGSDVCVGDFNGDGKNEILVPDAFTTKPRPINDLVIYEVDWRAANATPTALHRLPPPIWDRTNSAIDANGVCSTGDRCDRSHDQRCRVADFDHDGRLDVLISSTAQPVVFGNWGEYSHIQIFLNRGNWVFEDISDRAFAGRPETTNSSLTLSLVDINGDGNVDLFYPADSQEGKLASQVWYGNGDGTFRMAADADISALVNSAASAVRARRGGGVQSGAIMSIIPLRRADGRYDFVVPVRWNDGTGGRNVDFELSRVGWVFR